VLERYMIFVKKVRSSERLVMKIVENWKVAGWEGGHMPLLMTKEGQILAQLHRHSCCCKFSHYPQLVLWICILDLFPLFVFSDLRTRSFLPSLVCHGFAWGGRRDMVTWL
jgi:hypothetical protein